jgi:hypothetical protein
LLILCLHFGAGCQSFNLAMISHDRPPVHKGELEKPVHTAPDAPSRFSFYQAPYLFLSDFEIKRDLPVFKDLATLRDQVYKELQLPSSSLVVQVYLFESRPLYAAYMEKHYNLPARRAFFIGGQARLGGPKDLYVYTFWDPTRIQQDLRHELTHALLHSVLQDVPLWLDEGLAEYFEQPSANQGLNLTHLQKLHAEPLKPDLARLENLKNVPEMTPEAYRESWAWVHLMLRSRPEARKILLDYLHQCRDTPTPPPLRPRLLALWSAPENVLLKHLAQLEVTRK